MKANHYACLIIPIVCFLTGGALQASFDRSKCIGNYGFPNPWPSSSAFNGGYIPLGTFGAQTVFSISMWINPSSQQNGQSIILDASHGGSRNWVIQTLNSGSTWGWGSESFTLTPNTWQHLLLTYNNGSKSIFVNGTLVQSWFQAISYSGSPALYLGNWPEGGRRFNGLIDELYITKEILHTSPFTPEKYVNSPSQNTLGLWHFDEGVGTSTIEATTSNPVPLNDWHWASRELAPLSNLTATGATPHTNGWYYQPEWGWIWTNANTFPYVYRSSSGGKQAGWLYFREGSAPPYFHDYATGTWTKLGE
jgi:hypothetical protein